MLRAKACLLAVALALPADALALPADLLLARTGCQHSLLAGAGCQQPSRALRCAAPRMTVFDDGSEEACDEGCESADSEAAALFRKRKGGYKLHTPKDNRDLLLYDVVEETPPPTPLGRFRLGASAACGDMIQKGEQTFVIKRVAYRYELKGGQYAMTGKGAYVKEASRDGVEAFLRRLLPEQ